MIRSMHPMSRSRKRALKCFAEAREPMSCRSDGVSLVRAHTPHTPRVWALERHTLMVAQSLERSSASAKRRTTTFVTDECAGAPARLAGVGRPCNTRRRPAERHTGQRRGPGGQGRGWAGHPPGRQFLDACLPETIYAYVRAFSQNSAWGSGGGLAAESALAKQKRRFQPLWRHEGPVIFEQSRGQRATALETHNGD